MEAILNETETQSTYSTFLHLPRRCSVSPEGSSLPAPCLEEVVPPTNEYYDILEHYNYIMLCKLQPHPSVVETLSYGARCSQCRLTRLSFVKYSRKGTRAATKPSSMFTCIGFTSAYTFLYMHTCTYTC